MELERRATTDFRDAAATIMGAAGAQAACDHRYQDLKRNTKSLSACVDSFQNSRRQNRSVYDAFAFCKIDCSMSVLNFCFKTSFAHSHVSAFC